MSKKQQVPSDIPMPTTEALEEVIARAEAAQAAVQNEEAALIAQAEAMAEAAEADVQRMRDLVDRARPKRKLPVTSPWAYNRWHRDLFALQSTDPNWEPRWCHPYNVERHIFNGARLADVNRYKGRLQQIPGEEGQLDSRLRCRGLILLEFPKAVREAHRRILRAQTELQITRAVDDAIEADRERYMHERSGVTDDVEVRGS